MVLGNSGAGVGFSGAGVGFSGAGVGFSDFSVGLKERETFTLDLVFFSSKPILAMISAKISSVLLV